MTIRQILSDICDMIIPPKTIKTEIVEAKNGYCIKAKFNIFSYPRYLCTDFWGWSEPNKQYCIFKTKEDAVKVEKAAKLHWEKRLAGCYSEGLSIEDYQKRFGRQKRV